MKLKRAIIFITLMIGFIIPIALLAQEEEPVTIRTLKVDWHSSSRVGVKVQYRGFDNTPHFLYLPKSFEKKFYRFVEAPKDTAQHGLPILIVRMRGQEIIFIDIYTQYMGRSGRIADFDEEDMEKFRAVESAGKVEMKF